jgi:hypothetical protein
VDKIVFKDKEVKVEKDVERVIVMVIYIYISSPGYIYIYIYPRLALIEGLISPVTSPAPSAHHLLLLLLRTCHSHSPLSCSNLTRLLSPTPLPATALYPPQTLPSELLQLNPSSFSFLLEWLSLSDACPLSVAITLPIFSKSPLSVAPT